MLEKELLELSENFFKKIEFELTDAPEQVLFSEKKIRALAEKLVLREINKKPVKQRPAFFEKIICDFFIFRNFKLIKTKKTRDLGLDALIKTRLEPFGELSLGLQIKYKKIGSIDVDLFLRSLDFADLKLGALVCKDSRRLDKYTLSAKLKAMLFGLGEEASLKKRIDLKPVFILKFSDILDVFTGEIRLRMKGIYKR